MLRKLPLSGVQDFAKVRNDFAVYVDKTAYMHKMISNYNSVFFARPRRFGKSLTCSALKAVFENKKNLFKGLAIEAFLLHKDMNVLTRYNQGYVPEIMPGEHFGDYIEMGRKND